MKIPKKITEKLMIEAGSDYEEYCEYVNRKIARIAVSKGKIIDKWGYCEKWLYSNGYIAFEYTESGYGYDKYKIYLRTGDEWHYAYIYSMSSMGESLQWHIPGQWINDLSNYE